MEIIILAVCEKEIASFPREVIEDFLDTVALLREGLVLSMPLSKAMPQIGKNIHELRLKDRNGIYRIFYVIKKKNQELNMKSKNYKKLTDLALALGLPESRGHIAMIKAKLTKEIINTIEQSGLTHQEVSDLSGVPRSSITGIITGSLQKVSIDRLVRIITALGKNVELKIKTAA